MFKSKLDWFSILFLFVGLAVTVILLLVITGVFVIVIFRMNAVGVVVVNDTGRDVRGRVLEAESSIPSPFISGSFDFKQGTEKIFIDSWCVYIEDNSKEVIGSLKMGHNFMELIKLALFGSQKTIYLSNKSNKACSIEKEEAKTCYMGKLRSSVEDCP